MSIRRRHAHRKPVRTRSADRREN